MPILKAIFGYQRQHKCNLVLENYTKICDNSIDMKSNRLANIKIKSTMLKELKALTGQKTGQGATEQALIYFIREARQRDILKYLSTRRFDDNFNPVELRSRAR